MTYPSFNVGEVVTANDMNAVGLWLVKSTTFSNVASVQLDDCFTSDYERYRVLIEIYSSSTNGRYAWFRLVDGTTPAATNYLSKSYWYDMSGTSLTAFTYDTQTTRGCLGPIGYVNTGEGSYELEIHYPKATRNTRVNVKGQGLYAGSAYLGVEAYTLQTTTTAFEGLYLFPNADNITGVIKIYGYRD